MEKNRVKILATSQFFGFAPSSELLAFLHYLTETYPKRFDITILLNSHIETLLKPGLFKTLRQKEQQSTLDFLYEYHVHERFDYFISFYEPSLIYYAWFHDMKTFFYDGLFDFWDISSFKNTALVDMASYESLKKEHNFSTFKGKCDSMFSHNFHQLIFGAHFLAKTQFIKRSDNLSKILVDFPMLKNKLHAIGNIINTYTLNSLPYVERDCSVLSLGGSLNPVMTIEQNLHYLTIAIDLYLEYISKSNSTLNTFYFFCNANLLRLINTKRHKAITFVESTQQEAYFKVLRRANIAFLPPSHTAIQEATYFKVPVFILPEQNGGQPHNVANLVRQKFPTELNLTVTLQLHNGKTLYGEYDTKLMYKNIENLFADRRLVDGVLKNAMQTASDKTVFSKLVARQTKSYLLSQLTNDGIAVMANKLISAV